MRADSLASGRPLLTFSARVPSGELKFASFQETLQRLRSKENRNRKGVPQVSKLNHRFGRLLFLSAMAKPFWTPLNSCEGNGRRRARPPSVRVQFLSVRRAQQSR